MMGVRREHMVLFFKRIGFTEVRKRVAKNKTKNYCYGNGFFFCCCCWRINPGILEFTGLL